MTQLWFFEVAVLVAAACQATWIMLKPPVWREVRENPGLMLPLLAATAGFGALALWAAITWPAVRHVLAALLMGAMASAWWRARLSYGWRRRWPRGSLGIGHSLDALNNKRYYLEQAARFGPIFKTSQFGRPVVCMVGLDHARRLLANHAASLASATLPYNRLIPRGLLRYMRPEHHKTIAPLFRTTFSSLTLEPVGPALRLSYRRALARLAADSSRSEEGVRARPYFERAVLEALALIFYGLGREDPRVTELGGWMPSLLMGQSGKPWWRRHTRAGLAGVTTIMRRTQAEWPADPGQGTASALRALVASVPNAIDDPTIAGNFILITRIAYGDLTGLHDWVFKFLCDHPTVLVPLRAAGSAEEAGLGAIPNPATRIVMETLRLEQTEFLYRKIARPIEFEGLVLPAGWFVRLCTQESHRDPTVFPEPERFDPDRFARRAYSRAEYSPFGADAHGCMGSQFALLLGRILVEELALGYDWRVVSDGPLERGNRHRHHWRPTSRLRIVMTPRPAASPIS